MPRKYESTEKYLKADPKFNSKLVSKFVNNLMWDGKKTTAQRIFYKSLDIIKAKLPDEDPFEVFVTAVNNVKPMIEVRSKRVGGTNYQVPMQVNAKRQLSLSIRWIRQAVRAGSGRPFAERLAAEIMSAFNNEGAAMQKREMVHRMAEANKAFAHFAWR